jgi:drug/metabolite transporter (DMT)-like permease
VPPLADVLALVALGIVNTGLAYWLFYLLIDEAGAASAAVITYVMPVVALVLGVAVLGESLSAGAVAGLVLIALGAWLATTGRAVAYAPRDSPSAPVRVAAHRRIGPRPPG